MPYCKLNLAEMKAVVEECVDIDTIAERFGVHHRTVERLIEMYAKRLEKSRRRRGRKILYQWADILKVAKIHKGIEKENIPSRAIKRAYKKQRANELVAEAE